MTLFIFIFTTKISSRPACAKNHSTEKFLQICSSRPMCFIHSNLSSSYSILIRNKSKVKLKLQIEAFSYLFQCFIFSGAQLVNSYKCKKILNWNRKVIKVKALINFINFPRHLFKWDEVREVGFGLRKSFVYFSYWFVGSSWWDLDRFCGFYWEFFSNYKSMKFLWFNQWDVKKC